MLPNIDSAFQPDPICGGRVVLFRGVDANGALRLVESLSREFRPYAACDQDESTRLEQLAAGDCSFMNHDYSSGCMVEFDSDTTPIRRIQFRFYGPDSPQEATLYFMTSNLSPGADAHSVLSEVGRLASILGAKSFRIHEETNSDWHVGDFSDATLICERNIHL